MPSSDLAETIAAAAGAVLHASEAAPPAPQHGPIARYIDHTLLKPEATPAQVAQLCAEAREHHFASVCVNPSYVRLCAEALAGSGVAVCTVAGFPLGATTSAAKAAEAAEAIAGGAREVDMVIAVGRLVGGDYGYVLADIAAVVDACHSRGALCKAIIETALLSDEQKVAACLLAARAGVDFVKTSTGFSTGGATAADIALMRRAVGPTLGVKASGGVRDLAGARAMIAAGATRIGASAGVAIVREEQGDASQTRRDAGGY